MPKKKHKPAPLSGAIITIFLVFSTTIDHVVSDDSDVMALLAKSITPTPSGWSGSDYCHWTGVSCGTSSKVSSINLSSKSLSGNIPKDINQLSGLKSLSLQRNRFTGPLPALSNMDSLEDVNLDDNSFDSIPQGFLSGLTSLQSFSMNDNSNLPPWTIPDTLKDSTSLASFFASKVNIVGEIPDIFGSFPNLQSLRLSYNNLTGSLPASFYNSRIQNMWLNNQATGLMGSIDVLGSMTQSQQIWLHGNKFSGPIPDLSACTGLTDLQLRNNLLTGVIPDSLTKLPKLQSVALQNNKFQGPMPSFPGNVQANLGSQNNFCLPTPGTCDLQVTTLLAIASAVFYPMTLAESWKGNDACQGWKFVTCESGSVTMINFGKQNWTGTISPAFANLTNLKSLLLNDNQLDGTIPEILTGLKQLRLLDISNNNISGKVPVFPSSVMIKVSGNVFIGKDVPVSPGGKNSSTTNTGGNVPSVANNEADSSSNSNSSSMSPWMIVILVGVVLVLVLAISGFLIFKRRYNKRGKGDKLQASKRTDNGISRKEAANDVNYAEKNMKINSINSSTTETPKGGSIRDKNDYHVYDGGNITIPIEALREATDNFSEHNILGKGGFGIVYSGKLDDGTRIAVKRMEASLINDKGMNEFKAEIEVLTKVRHRHLVSLHGFCDNGSERLLVYEYMPQGCLGRHLFDWKEMSVAPLTWNQRVTIALDVARGVEYLHSLAQQSFIHRDLKPSNILLGDDMRAKVADFGLVKSAPDGKYSLETKLAGTFGYLAPEYAATGRVTTKVDVFAFGVILMEIITGRKALDDSQPEDRCHLVAWFRRLLADKEAVTKAIDPVISSSTMDEEKFQSIWKVVELAGHCTAREPYQRPDMSHAVNVLAPLVEQWTPGPEDDDDGFGIDFNMSLPQVLQKWKASEDSSSAMSSDYYNGLTKDYSTSSNSTVEMIEHSRNASSSDVRH